MLITSMFVTHCLFRFFMETYNSVKIGWLAPTSVKSLFD